MISNKKGFSLVELFAIIFISTAIIFPLIATLADNFEINDRMHVRRSATSIVDSALYAFDKLDFTDLKTQVDGDGNFYIEYNIDNCSNLSATADQSLCNQVFSTIWNNLTFDATQYRVFIHNYHLTSGQISSLTSNGNIPAEVQTIIGNYTASTSSVDSLIRIHVWIQYDDDPVSVVVVSGLLFND